MLAVAIEQAARTLVGEPLLVDELHVETPVALGVPAMVSA
jgi:hypothetical protein